MELSVSQPDSTSDSQCVNKPEATVVDCIVDLQVDSPFLCAMSFSPKNDSMACYMLGVSDEHS